MASLFCGFVGFDVVDAHGLLWVWLLRWISVSVLGTGCLMVLRLLVLGCLRLGFVGVVVFLDFACEFAFLVAGVICLGLVSGCCLVICGFETLLCWPMFDCFIVCSWLWIVFVRLVFDVC